MNNEPTITLRELRRELSALLRLLRKAPELKGLTFREGQNDAIDLVRQRIVVPRERAARARARSKGHRVSDCQDPHCTHPTCVAVEGGRP